MSLGNLGKLEQTCENVVSDCYQARLKKAASDAAVLTNREHTAALRAIRAWRVKANPAATPFASYLYSWIAPLAGFGGGRRRKRHGSRGAKRSKKI